MMNAILLLYSCCDHTGMKGILVSIIIILLLLSTLVIVNVTIVLCEVFRTVYLHVQLKAG